MQYLFTNEYPLSKLDEIVAYLLGPRLWVPRTDYPDFGEWSQKVHEDLKQERKRALAALSGANVVGAAIYQRHKTEKDSMEIKNLTVRPDERGRYIASFLLRNAEIEGRRDFKVRRVLCDAKRTNAGIRWFLLKHRYVIAGIADLYKLGAGDDLVFRKDLPPRGVILP